MNDHAQPDPPGQGRGQRHWRPLERHATLPALLEGMKTPGLRNEILHSYRIPLAEFLTGHPDAAREALRANLAKLGERKARRPSDTGGPPRTSSNG